MSTNAKPIPDGFRTVTPYLIVKGAGRALDFYKRAFGAKEICRMTGPDGGSVAHAEIQIGDSIIMLGDESPHCGSKSPETLQGTPVSLYVYVPDVDAAFQRATGAGATVQRPVEDKFYGDRSGSLVDPFGHQWSLATHIEDVPPDEMKKRMEEFFAEMTAAK